MSEFLQPRKAKVKHKEFVSFTNIKHRANRWKCGMFAKLTCAADCVECGYPQKTGFMDRTTIYEAVGGNIRRERVERHMNQAELARRVGLSRTSVTNLELGRQSLLVHQLVSIANALGVEPASLITIDTGADTEAAPELSPALSLWVESLKSRSVQG